MNVLPSGRTNTSPVAPNTSTGGGLVHAIEVLLTKQGHPPWVIREWMPSLIQEFTQSMIRSTRGYANPPDPSEYMNEHLAIDGKDGTRNWEIVAVGRKPTYYMARDLLYGSLLRDYRTRWYRRYVAEPEDWMLDMITPSAKAAGSSRTAPSSGFPAPQMSQSVFKKAAPVGFGGTLDESSLCGSWSRYWW
jgi:hypothetical protein